MNEKNMQKEQLIRKQLQQDIKNIDYFDGDYAKDRYLELQDLQKEEAADECYQKLYVDDGKSW